MGYTENCLPPTLVALGHEVSLLTTTFQVYGRDPDYGNTYAHFLGPRTLPLGKYESEGVTVYRAASRCVGSYIWIKHLWNWVRRIQPDVVQLNSAASLNTFWLSVRPKSAAYAVFTECHQHESVAKRLFADGGFGARLRRFAYRLTRTWPSQLAHRRVEKCFAISEDTGRVAHSHYGVPREQIEIVPLGTRTDLFRPAQTYSEEHQASAIRRELGVASTDLLCVYSGRLSGSKNPLLLARAVARLRRSGTTTCALFIGEGPQAAEIRECDGARVVPFMRWAQLPPYYRAADVGVWPCEESLSMLDCASCGVPVVCNDKMGDPERIRGNGRTFRSGSPEDLAAVLSELSDHAVRRELGANGQAKMVANYSWTRRAKQRLEFYQAAAERLDGRRKSRWDRAGRSCV